MPVKYVFLDFDGVCNNYAETPGSYITHGEAGYGISPSNMKIIVKLCEDTGAKIVVSSNWRRFSEDPDSPMYSWNNVYGKIPNPMPEIRRVFGKYVIGTLPKDRHMTKAEALGKWFVENDIDFHTAKYVIFDDDPAEGYESSVFSDHFILTNSETGITEENAATARWMLENF